MCSDADRFTEIPFRFEHGEILVQAVIGGRGPFTLLLDTNTSPSALDLAFAKSERLALRAVHGAVAGGGAGHPQVYLTKLPMTELGRMRTTGLEAVAIDLSNVRDRLGVDIKGVLGDNFLSGRVVQINSPKRMIRFYSSSLLTASERSGRLTFPFKIDDEDIVMEGVRVNGRKIPATIDTGSDGTFKLTPSAVESLGLSETASKGTPQTSVGYKGTAQNTTGKVNRSGKCY